MDTTDTGKCEQKEKEETKDTEQEEKNNGTGLLTQPEQKDNDTNNTSQENSGEQGTRQESNIEVLDTPAKRKAEVAATPRQSNNSKATESIVDNTVAQPRTIDFGQMEEGDNNSIITERSINTTTSQGTKGSWRSNRSKVSKNGTINHHFRKKGNLGTAKVKDKAAAKYKRRRSDASIAVAKKQEENDNNKGPKEPDQPPGSETGKDGLAET
jgi:hypothetical protein